MSWAEKIRLAREAKAPEQDMKKVTVVGPMDGKQKDLEDENKGEISSVNLPEYKKGLVVLDANAFIKGMDNLLSLADALITVPQVVREVKDARARELLENLPLPLTQLDPTPDAMKEVMDMSKKTGDFGVLSRTDIRIAALALDAAKQTGKRKDCIVPRPATINPGIESGVEYIDDEVESGNDDEEDEEEEEDSDDYCTTDDEEWEEEEDEKQVQQQAMALAKKTGGLPGMVDQDDDDGGDWITPSNIKENQAKDSYGEAAVFEESGVACITSDFPIQNVLMHLGVTVVGTSGMAIKQLRTWLLRCHACGHLVHDTTRQFCPACGSGNTLKRVSYEVGDDGKKHLFVNFKRKISTRGNVYALPKPRGGRRGTNKTLALREDQLSHITHPHRNKRKEAKVVEGDQDAVFGEAKRSRFDPNKLREKSSYRKYNPNEKKKQLAGRRK